MPHLRPRGFTLLEMLLVLTIVGLLGSIALPAMGEAIARRHLRAAAEDLLQTLQKARSRAVWRDHETQVCASSDGRTCSPEADWTHGWIGRDNAFKDVFTVTPPLDAKLATARRPGREEVHFTRAGTSPGKNQTIVLCVRGRPATAVTIVIGNAGRPHRESASPDDAALCAKGRSRRR